MFHLSIFLEKNVRQINFKELFGQPMNQFKQISVNYMR